MSSSFPRVFALDPQALAESKKRSAEGDRSYQPSLARLKEQANQTLLAGPFSVTYKTVAPPGGDKHDYMSLARYYWPNPDTPNGMPYVSLDGQVNPEIFTIPDHKNFDALMDNVLTLGLAFYLTGEARYADYAATLLRVWFLDQATRMNPNLNYGQGIRGINDGRNAGIIETRELAFVVDAIGLIAESGVWTSRDQLGMERWFEAFLDWLVTSELGKAEARNQNNHGTFYDAQIASLALFLGKDQRARDIISTSTAQRIPIQFEPDGRQPLELERTMPWHYCVFNLTAWFRLAFLGEKLGLDVWNYQTVDGRCIRKGLDFLAPFGTGTPWRYSEISARQFSEFYRLLRIAAYKYRDSDYLQASLRVPNVEKTAHRVNLELGCAQF